MKNIGIIEIIQSIGSLKIKTLKIIDLIIGGLLARIIKAKPLSKPFLNSASKILIIRPGGIGDAIFLLPIIRAIKNNYPDIQIDILCEQRNKFVFESQKDLKLSVFCYDKFSDFLNLRKISYDIIIDTEQWHYLSALLAFHLTAKNTVGFSTRPLRSKCFSNPIDYDTDCYELNNFQRLFVPFFPEVKDVTTITKSFIINNQEKLTPDTQISGQYITFCLGTSIPIKRLELQQCCDIIQSALRINYSVALLGGKDVKQIGERITQKLPDNRIINFIGKSSLLQTAHIIKNSSLFIGPDSGIMHLACAVGTPVKAIFGPSNPKKWHPPKEPQNTIISLYVDCSPCAQFGYTVPTCRKSYHCMKKINAKMVRF